MVAFAISVPAPAFAEVLQVPSGMEVALHEAIYEPVGTDASSAQTLRLRFVASEISDETRFGIKQIESDFEWLCTHVGLVEKQQKAPEVQQIIVSLSSETTAFGESAPEVVQYFDAFRVEDGRCIWEGL
ncbi:MAG: DUF6497 family protein [Litoreibacter sp.]